MDRYSIDDLRQPGRGEELLESGADPDARDDSGWTALHLVAFSEGSPSQARVLLRHGASVDAVALDGSTPLIVAAGQHQDANFELVAVLLDAGAAISAADSEGDTALHHAALSGSTAIIALLVAQGADVNARNKKGKTPLHLAVEQGDVETVNGLLQLGGDPNAFDHTGATALIIVAKTWHGLLPIDGEEVAGLVEILIEAGGNLDQPDFSGRPPRQIAVDRLGSSFAAYFSAKGS